MDLAPRAVSSLGGPRGAPPLLVATSALASMAQALQGPWHPLPRQAGAAGMAAVGRALPGGPCPAQAAIFPARTGCTRA